MSLFSHAHFPITGPRLDPTASDYALEAALLRQKALAGCSTGGLPRWRLYELAVEYVRLARRKRWAEQQAERNRPWWEVA